MSIIEQIEQMGDPFAEMPSEMPQPRCLRCNSHAAPYSVLCASCREQKWREVRQGEAQDSWRAQAEAERRWCGRAAKVGALTLAAWSLAPFCPGVLWWTGIVVSGLVACLCAWRGSRAGQGPERKGG